MNLWERQIRLQNDFHAITFNPTDPSQEHKIRQYQNDFERDWEMEDFLNKCKEQAEIIPKNYITNQTTTMPWEEKSKTIWGFKCTLQIEQENVTIKYRRYSFYYSYRGDVDKFIKDNNKMIVSAINYELQQELDAILKTFSQTFDETLKRLKPIMLPHTKDLLLANIIKGFGKNIEKVAKEFNEPSVKKTLLALLKA